MTSRSLVVLMAFAGLSWFSPVVAEAQSIAVSLPDTTTTNAEIDLPVRLGDTTGLDVVAINLIVAFDSTIVRVDSITTAGFLAESMFLTTNFSTADRVIVAGAGAAFLSGGGTLLTLHARFVGTGTTDLRFERFTFNEGSPAADVTNGSLSNAGGTATDDPSILPDAFLVHGNFPNPFTSETTLQFDLPTAALVRLEVIDMLGRQVHATPATLLSAGSAREIVFSGAHLPAGTYIIRLHAVLPNGERAVNRLATIVR